jgi:hypothetical protein
MKVKLIYILFIVIILVIGCARPPLEEMERAREAVFRAENDVNAAQYASGTLARARDALSRMEAEADSRRFDAASTHAAEAIAAAERAIAEGRTGAEITRSESASLLQGLRAEIEETSRNISSARYSQMVLDYDALDRAIVNAHNDADQAEFAQAAGRYQDAIAGARSVRADLAHINQIVASAAAPVKK